MLFNKAATKLWEKLTRTLSEFAVSPHRCSDSKNRDLKIILFNYFMLFAFNGLNKFSQLEKTVNHFFFLSRKMQRPVFVFSTVTK